MVLLGMSNLRSIRMIKYVIHMTCTNKGIDVLLNIRQITSSRFQSIENSKNLLQK